MKQEHALLDALHHFPRLRDVHPCLSLSQYVNILKDAVAFRKHILILRNFRKLKHYLVDGMCVYLCMCVYVCIIFVFFVCHLNINNQQIKSNHNPCIKS